MSSKVQQTFHQKLQKRKREKIFQIVFLLACQCVAVVQRFFVTRVVHCVTNSHNLKKYCACQKRVSTIWLAFSACVAFSVTNTKIRVMSELHSLKFQRTTKLSKQMEL